VITRKLNFGRKMQFNQGVIHKISGTYAGGGWVFFDVLANFFQEKMCIFSIFLHLFLIYSLKMNSETGKLGPYFTDCVIKSVISDRRYRKILMD